MNLLLDTHTFLWALFSDEKLSHSARNTITDSDNTTYVSPITFWEISLKFGMNRLSLPGVNPDELPDAAIRSDMSILSVTYTDMASFHRLPGIGHKDPFDRMLIWQAIQNQLTMIS